MKKSTLKMKSLHRNSQHIIMAITRRVFLILSFLTLGLGSVWGQMYKTVRIDYNADGWGDNGYSLAINRLNSYADDDIILLRYKNDSHDGSLGGWGIGGFTDTSWGGNIILGVTVPSGDYPKGTEFVVNTFTVRDLRNAANGGTMWLRVYNDSKLLEVSVLVNPFKGGLNTGVVNVPNEVVINNRMADFVNLDLNEIKSKLSDQTVRYARFYLTDAYGYQIDPANVLTVNYKGGAATPCISPILGSYLYYKDRGVDLTADMFHEWNGYGAVASSSGNTNTGVSSRYGEALQSGNVVIGVSSGSVPGSIYANLAGYTKMVITGTPGLNLRVLMNRQSLDESGTTTYLENIILSNDGTYTLDLTNVGDGLGYVHVNSIKAASAGTVTSIKLLKQEDEADLADGLDIDQIVVRLNAPRAYKLYKVVCMFATSDITKEGAYFIQEPNFDLQYTYSFVYPDPITNEIKKNVPLSAHGMTLDVSSDNLDRDWDTSWDELSIGNYVKWYVVNDNEEPQPLKIATERQNGQWAIGLPDDFSISMDGKSLVANGKDPFVDFWNQCKTPLLHAPSGMDYKSLEGYKVVCEVYTSNDITGKKPNVRYTFLLYKDFLGELTDENHQGTKIIEISDFLNTSYTLRMSDALAGYNGVTPALGEKNYARIWLTTTDGTLVNPKGKLMISPEMPLYTNVEPTSETYGYYFIKGSGIDLNDVAIDVKLEAGSYNQYQVHVAFSTDVPAGGYEPNYDYVFTYGFSYSAKVKYKTLICKEVSSGWWGPVNWEMEPNLLYNWTELAVDCNVGKTLLNSQLYLHWYLIDGNGNRVQMSSFKTPGDDNWNDYSSDGANGYYHWGNANLNMGNDRPFNDWDGFNPTIAFQKNGDNYKNVRLVCEATISESDPGAFASDIRVKYIYMLKTEDDLKQQPFVHYQGEAYRYLKEIGDDEQAAAYNFDDVTGKYGNYNSQQYVWNLDNLSTNDYKQAESGKNIRQKAHTVDYYYYVNPGKKEKLILPLQYYLEKGHNTEARAYYRWYNYKTDTRYKFANGNGSGSYLSKSGNSENELKEEDRGLFALRINDNPCHNRVGVEFQASQADFDTEGGEVLIACDISRYLDGMDESFKYLVHEPTILVRYVFHIMPTSTITSKISEVGSLTDVEDIIKSNQKPTKILEYEGRTVVSTNEGVGEFSLRTKLNDLKLYYGDLGNDNLDPHLWWYAYYKDKNDHWWRLQVKDPKEKVLDWRYDPGGSNRKELLRSQMYQAKYSLDDLKASTDNPWKSLSNQTTGAPTQIGVGDRVQMVACVGKGSSPNETDDMPIIWTELDFINAKPLMLGYETVERTEGYLKREYTLADSLELDNFTLMGKRRPQNSYDNYGKVPLLFDEAQYGFGYPQLYGFCDTDLRCGWAGYGISPMHGDYLLLKSMNMPGVSVDTDWYNQSIFCNWWEDEKDIYGNSKRQQLYDVTHEREHGKDYATSADTYGGFLYVDASDEARTIAKMKFEAELCHGAKIYYSAYIASMTGYSDNQPQGQTPPMLRFRVTTWDESQQKYIPVVTFVTGDIKQEVNHDAPNSFEQAHWYQVYGYTTIPSELEYLLKGDGDNPKKLTYYVEIDNYCDNTDGADYCIDQITFYTSNAKLKVKQATMRDCDDEDGLSMNIYVNYDEIKDYQNNTTIFWRICDENNNPLQDAGLYNNNDNLYGQIDVYPLPENIAAEEDLPEGYSGYFKGNDGTKYFSILKSKFKLNEDEKYFISVYPMGSSSLEENLTWGNPKDICTVYSPVFVPKKMYLSVSAADGTVNPEVEVACNDHVAHLANFTMLLNVPDETQKTGFLPVDTIHFDYFIGKKEDLEKYSYKLDDNSEWSLQEALLHYRAKGKTEEEKGEIKKQWNYNKAGLDPRYESICKEKEEWKGYYAVINDALEKGKLYLSCSPKVSLPIDVDNPTVLALSVDETVKDSKGNVFIVCSPLALTFDVKNNLEDPSITLGFKDIDYPNDIRVVRVGKEQLDNMQKDDGGFMLHIPVNSFKANKENDNTTDSKLAIISAKLELLKYDANLVGKNDTEETAEEYAKNGVEKWTNDSDVKDDNSIYVATFDGAEISDARPYISLNFHGADVTKYAFKEGYTYRMFFQVKNGNKINDDHACDADVEFLLKVVPEYVTWNDGTLTEPGEVTENGNVNNNWNNDKNWSRSKKAELYKTVTNSDSYEDYDEKKTLASFVPMKFTYVTIPSDNVAPVLEELTIGSEGIYNATSMGDGATENIQYDLMVKIEDECSHSAKTNVDDHIYDCEKFYGNWAKEIYFKPRAELVNQHYLTYGKVWVEKELTAGTWTLMSTPLQNTYAGDMYVPYNDDANKHGRQETEAFIPIKMTELQDDELILLDKYSRTKYPIYQKSWGMNEGKVYTKSEDVRKSDYSALLNFPTNTVKTTFAEWSHTFNDVMVDYSTLKGFAIRAHKSDYSKKPTSNALIRLPKADKKYEYYDWKESNEQQPTTDKTLSRSKYGKLFTDQDEAGEVTYGVVYGSQRRTAKDYAEVTVPVGDVQEVDGYLLVGNPYLCSIDMVRFFDNEDNKSILDKDKYWTYEGNTASLQLSAGQIQPLQSFFVKLKEGVTVDNTTNVKFTSAMMVGNNGEQKVMPKPMMTMTAANDRGKSTATVSVGNEARSVETLFDSNLNDVPMVYTVAEGLAVSVNQLTEFDKPIAFGVTCAASNEPVAVTFTDIAQLTSGDVFVVDAVTGEHTTIGEGSSVSVQPNDYGRYFLLPGTTGINDKTAVQKGIIVSIRYRGVTVTSSEALTLVRATLLDGTTAYQYIGGDTTASFTLTPGVYIIYAENAAGEQQTVKVIVRSN